MATVAWTVLRHHRRKDGTYSPRIRVTHRRTTAYLPTGIYTPLVRFRRGSSSGTVTDGRTEDLLNAEVRAIRELLNAHHEEAERLDTAREVADLIGRLRRPRGQDTDFIAFSEELLRTLPRAERTRIHRMTALNALKGYLLAERGGGALPVRLLTSRLLRSFEAWLRTPRLLRYAGGTHRHPPMRDNGVADYMRCLRYLFNRLRDACNDYDTGDITVRTDPFRAYVFPRGTAPERRDLTAEDIRRIHGYAPARPGTAALARDLFLLSFAAAGMNAVDMYNCPPERDGRIEYRRTKTAGRRRDGARVSIGITPLMRTVIDRYRDPSGRRLLRLADMYASSGQLNRALSRGLRRIGAETGIEGLQFYSARHSFATIARNGCGAGMDDIALCLAHVSPFRVTDTYVRPDYGRVDGVIRRVTESVFGEGAVI